MGKKEGKSHQKKKQDKYSYDQDALDNMDDEIDAFHKQRDIVPLDVNDEDGDSDEDDELPIFDIKDDEEDDDDDEDDDNEDDDDANDDVAKMIRQRKFLRAKFGEGDDEIQDDDDEDDEEDDNKLTFGGKRFSHGAENRNFEIQSSDDEAPKEEEELALQIQREKARSLTMEDYDLGDISVDKDNEKFTSKDASDKDKGAIESPDRDMTFKLEDLNALSKEEQLNILSRSAPELVGWLSELKETHKQLECKINPFLSKVKKGEIGIEGGVQYFELKQILLLSYCQAITFYLLLKSEGQPVHDHPVIARLEEIKILVDQIKQIDSKLPVELEDILTRSDELEGVVKPDNENAPSNTNSFTKNQEQPLVSDGLPDEAVPQKLVEIQKMESSKDNTQKARKDKHQKDSVSVQSLEMLKVRASLEEKLKQKGLYSSIAPKPSSTRKRSRPVNGQLETYDDFDDDAADVKGAARLVNGSSKVSKILNASLKKTKVVSGDDDLPKRDDIGERRRKHELQVLAGAGVKNEDDDVADDDNEMNDVGSDEVSDEEDDVENEDSENEFYKQVEQQRAEKLAAKAASYSRNPAAPFSQPETVEGKRYISTQMLKNRGLTRSRNKDKKNPRKNYKLKHQKAVKNRKGQVQSIRKPTAPYGGELSGINANVSRSIRFKG
ncbi:PREDICTED: something about silencing protein 10 isoform X2 [Lupinus angustifolius]|uniref:something about silencing protein 10 isoform X2 n=1 Tax=Lupinus angustifolius TaxID=3871 RepID=UPI00092FC46C|nr:PREDICTED: something about silencing protein 10 isoform X2 [Lupinus angustifolius]